MRSHESHEGMHGAEPGELLEVVSERTPIRLGIVIALIAAGATLLIGTITGVWWWGRWSSSMETKVDNIQSLLQTVVANNQTQGAQIEEIKARLKVIETVGSPKAVVLEQRIAELQRQMDRLILKIEPQPPIRMP